MSQAPLKGTIPATFTPLTGRALTNVAADQAAVQALLQGAVNVENFTIPLYMAALTSIYGTIPNKGSTGQLLPGMVTSGPPATGAALTPNQQAYNTVFSVFVQEMLHLQLAANLAAVLGVTPKFFEGSLLQNAAGGWGCYGPKNTIIPHIIDLTDTNTFASIPVNLDGLTLTQNQLFLAVEQSHDTAIQDIKEAAQGKYFPDVPFANWTAQNTEADLPLFGTIGWMYYCLLSYLCFEYTDGQSLWDKMFDAGNLVNQRDWFNMASTKSSPKHPMPEYPRMPTSITTDTAVPAFFQALAMIAGISDQGEGFSINLVDSITQYLRLKFQATDNQVFPIFQPDPTALTTDYNAQDSYARATGDQIDHWERFNNLAAVIAMPEFMTFATWRATNSWTAADLEGPDYKPQPNLPSPQQVAAALNDKSAMQQLDHLVVGAINGINQTLTKSWGDSSFPFPYQAMAACGNRMTLYWAVMGAAPDLSQPLPPPGPGEDINHACQGLSTTSPGNDCAALSIYHTCSGSNACKGQGGCGYPNQRPTSGNYFSPSDNTCSQNGGCGAPISAWQVQSGVVAGAVMDIIDIDTGDFIPPTPPPANTFPVSNGTAVYDTAWTAYAAIMTSKGKDPGAQPAPNAIRIALPPN